MTKTALFLFLAATAMSKPLEPIIENFAVQYKHNQFKLPNEHVVEHEEMHVHPPHAHGHHEENEGRDEKTVKDSIKDYAIKCSKEVVYRNGVAYNCQVCKRLSQITYMGMCYPVQNRSPQPLSQMPLSEVTQ
ncbi:hypothetical protein O9G_000171 [Rozella allomycis CSF55]|uniref:Uncharacterized protein n=1 Tax=Rozella allomycis (strain CSF55) TaxID=988480 RepID=A0A075ANY9_ROZAC|nr:hypothetical protein O9G_000171 [Rozella allomycis CSF55]|eukprot:EPZ31692.1 hypothetical protein O9G_000171 [Rozella allomycis CSF55]